MSDRTEASEPNATEEGDANDELDRAEGDNEAAYDDSDDTVHLNDIEDGAGCTEIWERLSERRER